MTSNWGIKGSRLKEAGNEELLNHQKFQVPKMEVLNLVMSIFRWVFPYISRIHTAYIGEYLHFRYLKCLVIKGQYNDGW